MSSDLEIKTDSLDRRDGQSNSDLRTGEYRFFSGEAENPYRNAEKNLEANREVLKEKFFTGYISGADPYEGVLPETAGIFKTPAEYTGGRFDETGTYQEAQILQTVLIAAACAAAFLAARLWSRHKRKKAEKCISPSQ